MSGNDKWASRTVGRKGQALGGVNDGESGQQGKNQTGSQRGSDRVIVLLHHEEAGNSRIVRRVVRCHQSDEYGGAARSDSRSGCGPVDWRRHVFRSGACRYRHHAAQTSVGSGPRCRGLCEGLTGFESRTSRTPAGSPAVLEPKVDSLALRRVKHRVGSTLLERAAARSPLPRRRRGRIRRRYLFRLANKESVRYRQHESLLNAVVGQRDYSASTFQISERLQIPNGRPL